MNMMINSARRAAMGLALAGVALLMAGCAGSNFVKPEPGRFVLGKTTEQELSKALGKPYRVGTVDKNGKSLKSLTYAYANVGGETQHKGVTGARSEAFYFHEGTLVGTEFSSSFKDDGTDFDETKVAKIEKGKSSKSDVIQLLGPPGGEYMAPLIANPGDRALVYTYTQAKGSAFNMRFYTKTLVVSYEPGGLVTDAQYTAVGTKD